jgi:hypothetical protein
MMETVDMLTDDELEKVRKFNLTIGIVVMLLSVVIFWAGVNFLKEDVYKGYFNPTRHQIVEQDMDTGEILVWKDVLGNVYTPDDRDVRLFPYGVMVLILLLMGVSAGAYTVLTEHFLLMLVLKDRLSNNPRLQL